VRLYRVIKSGCDALGAAGLPPTGDVDEEEADAGRDGWNVCGGLGLSALVRPAEQMPGTSLLTVSKLLPLNIRSVVAATLPPFLCRSHMIVRVAICGNICFIRSTSASRTRFLSVLDVLVVLREVEPEKKNHLLDGHPDCP
jgi:hypothetical protein